MKNLAQWIAIALLVVVIILQSRIIGRFDKLKPAPPSPTPPSSNEKTVRLPSLEEIDQRILHWTMHHGATFSAKSKVSRLEKKIDDRLDTIEEKLNEVAQSKK